MLTYKIGVGLAIAISFNLMSCTDCTFKETDSMWSYNTSSHYEDSSHEYEVVVTVTDTTATEHYKTKIGGNDATLNCAGRPNSADSTITRTIDNYTETFYCYGGNYYSESVETFDFRAENSRYKSRTDIYNKHLSSCKAAGKYYGATAFY